MVECEAPSFSLGLDFDNSPPPSSKHTSLDHDDLLSLEVPDSDPETLPDPPRRILKRLRRGIRSSAQTNPPSRFDAADEDDDIEEFSSQEDPVQALDTDKTRLRSEVSVPKTLCVSARSSVRNHSMFRSSKVSLKGVGILTPHPSREKKKKQPSDSPASVVLQTGQSCFVFPKLAASPPRIFQLLDSDDDDLVGKDVDDENKVGPSSSTRPVCNRSTPLTSLEQDRKTQSDVNKNHDLWKDLSPVKNFSVPTPAFNKVCEEYFRSAKNRQVPKSGIGISENHNETFRGVNSGYQKDEQIWDAVGPPPPAHRYFFHEDPRIQQLVRSRLRNFSPLGVIKVDQQQNVSHIDYLGQFDNGRASKTPSVPKGCGNGSTSRKSKSKKLNIEETFNDFEGWVNPEIISSSRNKTTKRNSTKRSVSKSKNEKSKLNSSNVSGNWVEPKSCSSMPKDASERRVQASGQSAGHWYTGSDGRKVYVSKSGQELTGRNAYRQYRKESGTGVKKSNQKTSTKKGN